MDKSRYEILLKILEKGSFSATAEELGYTPSGLNRMMNSLEEDLGFTLFSRSKKGVRLTSDGERVLPLMEKIVYWERKLRDCTNEICGLESGTLHIGSYYSISSVLLPDMIQKFKQSYPSITVQVHQTSHQELEQWLEEGRVDLILTSKRGNPERWITLKKDPMIVWVNKQHPLAASPAIRAMDFSDIPVIITMPGQDTDSESVLNSLDIPLNIQYSSQDSYTSYRMVEAGLGISVNNLMMSQNWTGDVVALPFDPPIYVDLGIRYPRHPSMSAKKFCEIASACCSND